MERPRTDASPGVADPSAKASLWHERLGRLGFAAKGVLYGIVGLIAIAVALGDEKSTADQTGALSSLADSPGGKVMLAVLALGLGAYALFRGAEVFVGSNKDDETEDRLERAASVARFLIYATLCVTAIRLIANAGASSGNEDSTTSTVFDLPAGVVLVFIAGAVIVGVGLYQAYKAVSTSFEDSLELGRMSPRMRSLTHWLGITGHLARGVIFVIVGFFLIKAAVEHSSQEARGIDGALAELAQQAFGPILLFAVAAGLFLFGLYSLIEARYRKF